MENSDNTLVYIRNIGRLGHGEAYNGLMADETEIYELDSQVGFLLRQVNQRHLAIFGQRIPELTPMQFATLAKLGEQGAVSQNELGRQTAMDAATMKGVIDRLGKKGLVVTRPDPSDQRRLLVEMTAEGFALFKELSGEAFRITSETLGPLTDEERRQFLTLLRKLL